MITLEQVQKLDGKIKQAVSLISTLREENAQLRSTLSNYEQKILDLESMVTSLEDGQTKIELGLNEAIAKLDNLEIVGNNENESIGKLSPSDESAIVNKIEIDENDHSEQAENITTDSINSLDIEVETDEVETDEVETDEVETDEVETDEVETDEVETDEVETDEVETDEVETDEVETDEVETDEVETDEVETDEVETKPKKKSSDYSIPMLEIF